MTSSTNHKQAQQQQQALAKRRKWKQVQSTFLLITALSITVLLVYKPQDSVASGKWTKRPSHLRISDAASAGELKTSTETRGLKSEREVRRRIASAGNAKGKPPPQKLVTDESASCDFSNYRTAVCRLKGDVRVSTSTVELVSRNGTVPETRIRPYPRKWQRQLLQKITEVTIRRVDESRRGCDKSHSTPALIFSTGGYTGSSYHDFNDGLIPIYISSQRFQREVVFIIAEFKSWWMRKYGGIINQLTKYPVLDFGKMGDKVHCFPQVTVGLDIHDELAINPAKMHGKSMLDFQQVLRNAYKASGSSKEQGKQKPRLVLITRKRTRRLVNEEEVIKLARKLGFEVQPLEPGFRTEIQQLFHLLQSTDVLVGVHGAALTHLLFMRPGSVLIQIVPTGTESPSLSFYGKPAMKLGLHYIEHRILPSESTLKNRTAAKAAAGGKAIDWAEIKQVYLDKQHVLLSVSRFEPVLRKARALLV